ncbi:hypothetical protein EON65_03410 [archaeon]|nr:MAG: hypothetical protein EON65_03410 [archaeon]
MRAHNKIMSFASIIPIFISFFVDMVELTEEDYLEICAVCQTKQDNIANLDNQAFTVNTAPGCGHKFCSTCVKREFQSKRQFACPRCRVMVTEGKVRFYSGYLRAFCPS